MCSRYIDTNAFNTSDMKNIKLVKLKVIITSVDLQTGLSLQSRVYKYNGISYS